MHSRCLFHDISCRLTTQLICSFGHWVSGVLLDPARYCPWGCQTFSRSGLVTTATWCLLSTVCTGRCTVCLSVTSGGANMGSHRPSMLPNSSTSIWTWAMRCAHPTCLGTRLFGDMSGGRLRYDALCGAAGRDCMLLWRNNVHKVTCI